MLIGQVTVTILAQSVLDLTRTKCAEWVTNAVEAIDDGICVFHPDYSPIIIPTLQIV